MGYSPCKMVSFFSKIKNSRNGAKNDFTTTLKLLCAKKPLKKTPNIRKLDSILKMAKIGHDACGYSSCKMVSLPQKLKMQKRCEKRLYDHIKVVVWKKKRSKKHLIFENWQHFQNGLNWPRCMGYSPCKMVSLAQKLKMPKRCEKRLYDHIKVVVWPKNWLLKNT